MGKKDSRKLEKDKKKEKHSSKRRGAVGPTKRSSDLAKLLSWGLIAQPKLIGELPSIISAFDANQAINISGISNNSVREYLTELMQLLPVVHDDDCGWSKKTDVKSVSGFILNELLKVRAIVQPTELSSSQQKASRIPPVNLQELLGSFPELTAELPLLLEKIIDGDGVQLASIENSDVRHKLCSLMEALGAEEDEDGAHSIDNSSPPNKISKEAFQHFLNAFTIAQAFRPLNSTPSSANQSKSAPVDGSARFSGGSSSSDEGDSDSASSAGSADGSDSNDEGDVRASKRTKVEGSNSPSSMSGPRCQGPSMPSAAQLEAAKRAAEVRLLL
jgi:hypothetical protein